MANGFDIVKKIGTPLAIGAGAEKFYPGTLEWTKNSVENILNQPFFTTPHITSNPLFAQASSFGTIGSMIALPMLTNNILKSIPFVERHKWIRYVTNSIAASVAYIGGTAASPYILGGSLAYSLGKPIFDRLIGGAYGAIGGGVKGALKGLKHGLKGNQFRGTGLARLNPDIS